MSFFFLSSLEIRGVEGWWDFPGVLEPTLHFDKNITTFISNILQIHGKTVCQLRFQH